MPESAPAVPGQPAAAPPAPKVEPPKVETKLADPPKTDAKEPAVPAATAAETLKWFSCRTDSHVGSYNIFAKDAEAAEARFKKALGIRSTPYKVVVSEQHSSFSPSDRDREFHAHIDRQEAPAN